ncbi:hypothetical protein J2Z26_000926 [Bacillus luteolus]|nr:hypothetical protein [Cytobacillus luteolus]
MNIAIFQFLIFQLILPSLFIVSLYKGSMRNKMEWVTSMEGFSLEIVL